MRIVLLVGISALVVQLVNIQVIRSKHFQALSADQLAQPVSIPALRGEITDRYGQVLAMSIPTTEVIADDQNIADPGRVAAALAPILGEPVSTVLPELEKVGPGSGDVILTTTLSPKEGTIIANDSLAGISTSPFSIREAPDGALASSVVGTINSVGDGTFGLETQFQKVLAGQNGLEDVFESPYGVALPAAPLVLRRAVPGTSLELTLDAPLQYVTEQALAHELVASHALDGTAIVMDTRTGQILSMANLVNVRQHDAQLPSLGVWKTSMGVPGVYEAQNNLAVSQVYEPGSVFKIVPFSAALLSKRITPTTRFSVPDYVIIDGALFHDAEQHGLEHLTATQILEYSSNIGTYEITQELGEPGLLAGVTRLGFGEPTGLGFPDESQGLLTTPARFTATSMASLPIGQQDAVTALQVLDAYNTIANGGVFVAPSLVRAEVSADGSVVRAQRPIEHRVLPAAIAAELNQMLVQVVAGGTGIAAGVPGYTIAGKTGTAQIPSPKTLSYLPGAYNATFVGFAPAQHPELAMIVLVQRPIPVIYGGDIAAPVFSQVMSYALHRYGVPATTRILPNGSWNNSSSVLQDVT